MTKRATVDKAAKNEPQQLPLLCEAGLPGLKRQSGLVREEFLTELIGSKGIAMYREMRDNEPVIAAALFVYEVLIKQAEIRVEAYDASTEAQQQRDFVETAIEDIEGGGFAGVVSNALTMLPYGWAIAEKVFKLRKGPEFEGPFRSRYSDGRWGWRKFGPRAQSSHDTWEYGDDGDTILGFYQKPPPTNQRRWIPREKYLHWRLRPEKDNPEGYSLIRPCYKPYYFKKNFEFVEAVGIERYMSGLPVMELPLELMQSSASAAQLSLRATYERLVREVRVDEQAGIVIPSELDQDGKPTGYKFKFMSGGSNKPADVDPVIRRLESRMAMSMLTEVMLLGSEGVGSYSLSRDKTELMVVGLGAILDAILEQFNVDAIPELVRLNGWNPAKAPYLAHGDIKAPNLADIAAFLGSVTGAGILVPDDATEAWARGLVGAPESERPEGAPRPGIAEQGGDDMELMPGGGL